MRASVRLPVGYVGHGNPLNVVDESKFSVWRDWGASLPTPTAVLVVSAHWEESPVTIGRTRSHDELLYDFWGFPEFMYELSYPAPGAPQLADRVESLLSQHTAVVRSDRPVDHGAWVPLIHMFPDADIPVLQISMPAGMTDDELYSLGGELSPLRSEGVFILGTGNLVHNLAAASWQGDAEPPDYAIGFDSWAARALTKHDHSALTRWTEEAPDPLRSHPSAEHYRPILVAAGAGGQDEVRFPVEGFEMGTVARRSVQFD